LAVCREKDEASTIKTTSAPLEAIPDQILRHDRPRVASFRCEGRPDIP